MITLSPRRKMLIGIFLLLGSVMSTVVAANISINPNSRVEFGQGLYRVSACDTFIEMKVERDGDNITELIIDGLDIEQCPDVYMRIKLFGSGNAPLNLYEESDTAVNRIMLRFNGQSDRFLGVDYYNVIGQVIPNEACLDSDGLPLRPDCRTDGHIEFDYFNGRYRVLFLNPMASASTLPLFNIETSSFPFDQTSECDVAPTVTGDAGGSPLRITQVIIENLDVQNCVGKYVRIQIRNSSTVLPLYDSALNVTKIQFFIDDENDFLERLKFYHGLGTRVEDYDPCPSDPLEPYCKQDEYLRITYLNGTYRIQFLDPLATYDPELTYQVDDADSRFP